MQGAGLEGGGDSLLRGHGDSAGGRVDGTSLGRIEASDYREPFLARNVLLPPERQAIPDAEGCLTGKPFQLIRLEPPDMQGFIGGARLRGEHSIPHQDFQTALSDRNPLRLIRGARIHPNLETIQPWLVV